MRAAVVTRSWAVALALAGCGRLGFDSTDGSGSGDDGAARGDGPPHEDAPHDATATDGATTTDGPGAADGASSADAAPSSLVVAFTLLPNANALGARRATGAAVAPDERIWVFGGFAGFAGPQDDVAGYSPSIGAWEVPTVTGTPPPRERHTLAWDAANARLVVFGGYSGSFPVFTHHDELFVFAPATNTWTPIARAGTWPAARKDAVMVWVPSLGRLLMYGGNDGAGAANRFSELWTLSIDVGLATATWTLLTPGGAAAPAQSAPCAAYDEGARRLILHGGEIQDGNAASTTYQYLVDANAWQLDTTTGTPPGARAFSHCAWDPVVARVVLYGGQSSGGSPIGGTYIYDPGARRWDQVPLQAGSSSPGNLSDGGAAYSATLGGMFTFGGRTATTSYTNQSWLADIRVE